MSGSATPSWPPAAGGTWIIDLDGVVWLAGQPIAGVPEALVRLRACEIRPLFASNNSSLTVGELLDRLHQAGVDAQRDDVVTSAQAAARLLEPGASALVLGGPGVTEALTERGVITLTEGPADAVVVGWTRDFDFARLAAAATAARDGARLIATNDDASYPTPTGLLPGAGALLAAVAKASGAVPEVAGKPHAAMAELVSHRRDLRCVVGDRPETDGLFAKNLGLPYALVLSGVTQNAVAAGEAVPAVTAPDLGVLILDILEPRLGGTTAL